MTSGIKHDNVGLLTLNPINPNPVFVNAILPSCTTSNATSYTNGGAFRVAGNMVANVEVETGNTTTLHTGSRSYSTLNVGTLTVTDTTDASSSSAPYTVGGTQTVSKKLYVGTTSNIVTLSTSSVTNTGGMGVGQDVFASTLTPSSTVTSRSTTDATDATGATGSLQFAGGVGIANNFTMATMNVPTITATSSSNATSSSSSGAVCFTGDVGIGGNIWATGIRYAGLDNSCKISLAGSQTVSNFTDTVIAFDTVNYDTSAGNYMSTTTNSAITALVNGYYRVSFHVQLPSASGVNYVRLVKNGTASSTNGVMGIDSGGCTALRNLHSGSAVLKLAAGDWIAVHILQNSGVLFLMGNSAYPISTPSLEFHFVGNY